MFGFSYTQEMVLRKQHVLCVFVQISSCISIYRLQVFHNIKTENKVQSITSVQRNFQLFMMHVSQMQGSC